MYIVLFYVCHYLYDDKPLKRNSKPLKRNNESNVKLLPHLPDACPGYLHRILLLNRTLLLHNHSKLITYNEKCD